MCDRGHKAPPKSAKFSRLVWLWLAAGVLGAAPLPAAQVLLVTEGSSLNTQESARKTSFESWGHTVTTIADSASQSAFDTAVAACDVVYVSSTVQEWELDTKVRDVTQGVICEERYLDVNMRFSTGNGWNASHTNIEILDNTHPVTSGLTTGWGTIYSSAQQVTLMNPTIGSGARLLARQNYAAGTTLAVFNKGALLAGSVPAPGRRVRLPWGVDGFSWSTLNTNGLKICRQAITWAAAGDAPMLWLKLDETSGSVAADASPYSNAGTLYGTASWILSPRRNGIDLTSGARVQVNSLLSKPQNFTIAAWVRADAVDSNGGIVVSIGDRISLVMDEPYAGGGKPTIAFANTTSSTTFRTLSSNQPAVGTGWHHYVATFDDAANSLKLYVDGQLAASTTTTDSVNWSTIVGTTTCIGRTSSAVGGYHLDGAVDDLRIYDYALNTAQIAEVYGLVAHWQLDATSGTVAVDSSGCGHDATLAGTQNWKFGVENRAHEFNYNNGDDYFTAPSTPALDNVQEDDYTVMAYFKPKTLPPGGTGDNDGAYAIVSKEGWHTGLVYGHGGLFYGEHWLAGGPTWSGAGAWNDDSPPGRFYHVAMTVNRASGTIKFYLDGVLKDTSTFAPAAPAHEYGSNRWRIGISGPNFSNWKHAADGIIDDVRIYNRALLDEELAGFDGTRLLAHWRLDEGTGTTVADNSPNQRHAAFDDGNPTWTAGIRGHALSFDGSSDVDTNQNFDPPPFGSVAFWFRSSATPTGNERLLGLAGNWEIRTNATQTLYCDLAGPSGGSFQSPSGVVVPQVWRHVVAIYDCNADIHKLYIDGALVSDGNFSCSKQSAARLTFGSRTGSTERFRGALDDIRIFNYELNRAEIAEIYGLIGHWKLDETTGTVAADSSGMERDGLILGSPILATSGPRPDTPAMQFDGSDDSVMLPDFDDSFVDGVTLAGWARPTATGWFQKIIQLSSGTSHTIDIGRRADSGDFRGTSNGILTHHVANTMPNNVWRHYAMTIDSSGLITLYSNGVPLGQKQGNPVAQTTRSTNWIGASEWSGDALFAGQLADVRVYNRAATQAEIEALAAGIESSGVRIIQWVEVR